MTDMDSILSIVENPTRRRILQALAKEPHYPLQLSHELGISQQAIMKNLALMEKEGLLESYRESSNMGPDRNFYRPTSSFSIIIDMRGNMFEVRMTSSERPQLPEPEEKTEKPDLDETRAKIAAIDRQLIEFEKQRQVLIRQRSALLTSFLNDADLSRMDYAHRMLIYDMLNRPNWNKDDLARASGLGPSTASEAIDDIVSYFHEEKKKESKEEKKE